MPEGADQDVRLLALLDRLLGSVGTMGAPVMISCASTFNTIKNLAFYVGSQFLERVKQTGAFVSSISGDCV